MMKFVSPLSFDIRHSLFIIRYSILSGSYDRTLKLWDVQSGQEVRTFKGHEDSVTGVCFAPGGNHTRPPSARALRRGQRQRHRYFI
jgi:WD40 repeat protein